MLTNKKTKIVATLGPACSTREIIKDMINAGVNVFRVNFSHADYNDVKQKTKIKQQSDSNNFSVFSDTNFGFGDGYLSTINARNGVRTSPSRNQNPINIIPVFN